MRPRAYPNHLLHLLRVPCFNGEPMAALIKIGARELCFLCLIFTYFSTSYGTEGLHVYPNENYLIPGKTVSFQVASQVDALSCVRIVVEQWEICTDGSERFLPTSDVLATPSQFFLRPLTTTKVSISSRIGSEDLQVERAYRLSFLQTPMDYRSSALRASTARLYVRPHTPRAELQVTQVGRSGHLLTVDIQNNGTAHCHLTDPTLIVRFSDGEQQQIDQQSLASPLRSGELHANGKRTLLLKLPEAWKYRSIASIVLRFSSRDKDTDLIVEKIFDN